MLPAVILILIAVGLVTGFYSGMLGVGGNIIIIPALDLLFAYYGVLPHDAVKLIIANSLFITFFLGLSVSYRQYKANNFYLKEVLMLGIPGMATAFVLTELIKAGTWYNKTSFDLLFLILLITIAIRMLFFKPSVIDDTYENGQKPKRFLYTGAGLFTGCITSLSGLGGGVILIPFLTDILKKPMFKAGSVSIGVITLLAVSVSSGYIIGENETALANLLPYQTGYVSVPLVLPVLAGIFISTSFGVKAAQKMKPRTLRLIFGVIITAIIAKTLYGFLG